ncbi:MAG: T9SS type A sorting domain-containing protein [Flavobacteriales bacterium]|nr:T9SS type A sorting domain-containing protein [Flavobacteriales bacterium]
MNAQNWALLNPAYRYNYSNDGTDTISNQIRVMHIDTLGVDSFRYELNLIGVVCDTCPASLGGPCDGCFVRVNQPQFLGYDCIRTGNNWTFNGMDTVLIRSDAEVGETWIFNTANAINATVDDAWSEDVFGVPDTLRRILLSDGDSILLSRSYGIVYFGIGGQHFDLIGVEGAGVGRLFPDLLDYFDYQVGDELTYGLSCTYQINPQGGSPYPSMRSHYWKAVITDRIETEDSVIYSTSVARTYPNLQWTSTYDCTWPMPTDQWFFGRTDIAADHPILSAYPGQVMDTSICWMQSIAMNRYIADFSTTSDGRACIRAQDLGMVGGNSTKTFNLTHEVTENTYPLNYFPFEVWYEQGIGLRSVVYIHNYPIGQRVDLVGAIVNGDTIIPPPSIDWDMSIEEESDPELQVFPNPASDFILLSSSVPGTTCSITDLQGRTIHQHRITSTNERIDVQALPQGVYVLVMDGIRPQRFLIAR